MEGAEGQIKAAVRTGVETLLVRGVSQAAIARAARVNRSQVRRWLRGETVPTIEACTALGDAFPEEIDGRLLRQLHVRAQEGSDRGVPFEAIGVEHLVGPEAVYEAAASSLLTDLDNSASRTIRHVALHLDQRAGLDPIDTDEMMTDAVGVAIRRFQQALARRARERWSIRTVVSASTPGRVAVIEEMAHRLHGPDISVRAYATRVPLVPNVLAIGPRDVILAVDHLRFERPESALRVTSTVARQWASAYFDKLFDAAPFRLREPAGVVASEFARLLAEVERIRRPV